ncbi:MAG: hypothetical protein RL625_806 [Gemmatimonadota bacterium]
MDGPRGTAAGETRRARRVRRIAGFFLAGLAGCASPGQPPGGPPDKEPPQLVRLSPDTNARNVKAPGITLRFDEVVNERSAPKAGGGAARPGGMSGGLGGGMGGGFGGSAGGGSSTLASMFVISPSDGRERILWKREAIEVIPRGGFRPQTTYRVVLLPGLGDLRGNTAPEGIDLVFSTGAQIAQGEISGALFDWPAGKVATSAPLEAFAPSDTLFRWRTRSDSTGRFTLSYLTPGTYHLRGWVDQNSNGMIDAREAVDTATVRVDSAATIDLYAFARDTIGPRIEQVEIVDSVALRIKFDRPTAVEWTPTVATVRLLRADSSVIALGPLLSGEALDSAITRARDARAAFRDSVRKDSLARDTTMRAPIIGDTAAPMRPAPAGERPRDEMRGDRRELLLDTDSLPADSLPKRTGPALNRPIPAQTWGALLSEPLPPGLYRVKLTKVQGMTGAVRDSEREIRLRPPPPPPKQPTTPPKLP